MTKFISKDNLTTFYSLLKEKVAMLDSNGNVPLSMLGNVDTELFVVLTELPSSTSGYANNKIYLVPTSVSETGNVYGEYIVVKDAWEKLGEFKADVDLSGYLTLDEAETRYANRTETFAAIQKKVDKVDGKALSTNDFTDELKTKLEGIEEGAQANVDAYKEVSLPDSNLSMYAGDYGNILTIKGKGGTTVSGDVLTGSITIGSTAYSAATTSAAGLMSAADKSKLDGISATNFDKLNVTNTGSETIFFREASALEGAIELNGDGGTTLTMDGNKVVIHSEEVALMKGATSSAAGTAGLVPTPAAGKQLSFLRGDGTWVVPTNTTYSVATTSANGLMSSTDKTKLNGVATGAQVNVLESVKIDGTAQTITSKAVNLETCTTSEINAIFS